MSRSRTTRASFAAALASALFALLPGRAHGADVKTPRPILTSLPESRLTPIGRNKAPASIGAQEKVSGFYLSSPPTYSKAQKATYVMVFPSKAAFEETFHGKRRSVLAAEGEESCFSISQGGEDGSMEIAFQASSTPMLNMAATRELVAYSTGSMVRAVRAERFVPGDGQNASLDITDAWVDPVSRGVRLIRRASIPLSRVTAGAGGLEVYAARDGQSAVELVVRSTSSDPRRPRASAPMTVVGASTVATSSCSHTRVRLKIEKNGGDMVTVQGEVSLPSNDEPAAVTPALDIPPETHRGVLTGIFGGHGGPKLRDLRLRQVRISGSTSWTSTDPEPLLAVSMTWLGRERRMQVVAE